MKTLCSVYVLSRRFTCVPRVNKANYIKNSADSGRSFSAPHIIKELSGTVVIGAGEVTAFGHLAKAMKTIHEAHPKLVFRPFSPVLTSDAYLAWKRGTTPGPAAQALINLLSGT